MSRSRSSASTKFYSCLLLLLLLLLLLFADLPVQMMWMVSSSLTLRRKERESDVALSHSPQTVLVLSFSSCFVVYFLFRRFVVFLFSHFVTLETSPSLVILFYLRVCRFVVSISSFSCFRLVVLHLKQIREPRDALLFALKEETCGEINRRRFLLPNSLEIKIIIIFYLPAQEIQSFLSRRHV